MLGGDRGGKDGQTNNARIRPPSLSTKGGNLERTWVAHRMQHGKRTPAIT